MPIEIERLESHDPILYYRFFGNITASDLDSLTANEAVLFAEIDDHECFYVAADWSQIETIATRLFPQLQQLRLLHDPHVCRVIVVGANPYLRALAISLGVVAQSSRFTFRATLDEALRVFGEPSTSGKGD